VLINITGGLDMTLFEVDEAANRIREEVDPDANIIFGSTFDEKLDGRMRISVVATGIDLDQAREPRPVISLVSDRSREGEAAKPAPSPAPAPAPVAEPVPALALEPSPPQAEAAEQAAVGKGSFIAPRPAEPAPARPAVAAAPPVQPAPVAKQEPAKPKSRMPSLFERVTNAGRLMKRDEPAPGPRVAPAGPPQPRLGTLDPSDRITAPAREEELLDIPAFLRRQAN
jgi:cell division protein FtsZ